MKRVNRFYDIYTFLKGGITFLLYFYCSSIKFRATMGDLQEKKGKKTTKKGKINQ